MASHPAAKTKPAKTLKPRQSKAAMLEKRQAKRVAKAEKRAEKMAKAKANAEAKKAVGGTPRKEKYGAKKRVISDAKKKTKLKLRVEKLEKKANNLFKEAKKAAAQYQALLDAEKNAAESKPEQDSNNDDDNSSSDSDTSSESGASEASEASENKGGVPVNQEPTEVPEDTPADEIVMKHRRLSNAGSERSRISVAEVPSEAEEEPKKSKKDKKNKKEKKVKIVEPEEAKEEAVSLSPRTRMKRPRFLTRRLRRPRRSASERLRPRPRQRRTRKNPLLKPSSGRSMVLKAALIDRPSSCDSWEVRRRVLLPLRLMDLPLRARLIPQRPKPRFRSNSRLA
ncbi:hypothetical protein NXS19_012576 [Fusarium pseudograminearum]|nr:hypothetical protein NXS19_012576 [Fusarium pseudograminearum]